MRKFSSVVLILIVGFLLSGCELLRTAGTAEVFSYDWAFADRLGPNNYSVQESTAADCSNPSTQTMTLAALAAFAQQGNFSPEVQNCFTRNAINVPQARRNGLEVKLNLSRVNSGPPAEYSIIATGTTQVAVASFSNPTTATLDPKKAMHVNEKTTGGGLSVAFGATFLFKAEGDFGDTVWANNIRDEAEDTYTEIKLTGVSSNDSKASANFKGILRRENDSADERVLIITNGTFALKK